MQLKVLGNWNGFIISEIFCASVKTHIQLVCSPRLENNPPVDLHLIEKSSLKNQVGQNEALFRTGFFQATQAVKVKF